MFSEGRTVCVSPFAGGQDICPLDLSGRGWYFSYNNQDFQWNKFNLARGIHALFPPSQDRLEKYFCRGKVDCIRFLKREGFLNPWDLDNKVFDYHPFGTMSTFYIGWCLSHADDIQAANVQLRELLFDYAVYTRVLNGILSMRVVSLNCGLVHITCVRSYKKTHRSKYALVILTTCQSPDMLRTKLIFTK